MMSFAKKLHLLGNLPIFELECTKGKQESLMRLLCSLPAVFLFYMLILSHIYSLFGAASISLHLCPLTIP